MTTSGIGRRRSAAQSDPSNTAYQRRRREIIEAAGHVFKKKGFQGTSLGDIAEHLGTDRANLYYYVGSKEELLDAAVSDAVQVNVARAQEIAGSDRTVPEKLRTLVIDLMTSYEEHYPYIYVYIQENLTHVAESDSTWARRMTKVNRQYERVVISLLEEGVADGSLRLAGPPWVVAYGIIGIVGWTNRWYDPNRRRDRVDAATIGAAYAEMILSGIVV